MNYNQQVEEYFFSPHHVGVLNVNEPFIIHQRVGEMAREAVLDLYVRYNSNKAIESACFKAYGSPYLIAGGEWLCRYMLGQEAIATELNYQFLLKHLDIPSNQYPVALLLEQAYRGLLKALTEVKIS